MLCACSGEQFKFEEPPQSPESLATRDFSASGLSSSRTGEWDSKFEDAQVDEVESTLKEALSLNYEEARALLGRLEYQRGNFDAALQVFQGIDIKTLTPRIIKAISERTKQRKPRSKGDVLPAGLMSMHSVSLLLEAILLKAKSLEELGKYIEAAKECKIILDTVESALPNGMLDSIGEDCKLLEMFHRALELLPNLWTKAGFLDHAITAYRKALVKPWNLDSERVATVQKELATMLLYGGVETVLPDELKVWGPSTPTNNTEEAILLLLILMRKVVMGEVNWDSEIMDHLTYALSITGQFELLAEHIEQVFPGIYTRTERWYFLALCYSSAGQNETALNLLKKVCGCSESDKKLHLPSFLFGAKLYSQDMSCAHEGINFVRKMIDLGNHRSKHFMSQAHKFLGICYGNAARVSVSDTERVLFQGDSLHYLSLAVNDGDDPEAIFYLGLENALQRNLDAALNNVMLYLEMVGGSYGRVYKLLALILSAKKQFDNAESIVNFALDEGEKLDQLEFLRLKAALQIAQKQPKQAIETYRILLALIQAQKDLQHQSEDIEQAKDSNSEILSDRTLEVSAWQDLSTIYSKLGLWPDSEICLERAKSIHLHSPRSWHETGTLFEARSLYTEALVSFSVALSMDPDYVPSVVSTAEVLIKLGGLTLPIARSFLMIAIRLEPTNHKAWFNLGMLAKKEGLLPQAVEFFQAAYELESSSPVLGFV